MSKFTKKEILAILTAFGVAKPDTPINTLERIQNFHPPEFARIISLKYFGQQYFILLDNQADNQLDFIFSKLQSATKITNYQILEPLDSNNTKPYALPYKGKDCYLLKPTQPSGLRLDLFLVNQYPDKSRSLWQKHIKLGHVLVDNQICLSSKRLITSTNKVTLNLPVTNPVKPINIKLLYLDDNIIVIDKPTGVLSHAKGVLSNEYTVADFFKQYTSYQLDGNRPGIVHRLDRDTSGVMIGARNQATAKLLQEQFANQTAQKEYVAITASIPKNRQARLELPIARDPKNPKTFRIDRNGKMSLTNYEVLETVNHYALIKLTPLTGRTHQLRVHLAYLNCPIVGDRFYGQPDQRLYLHAQKLTITVPGFGKKTFTSPLPTSFKDFLESKK